MWWDGKLCLCDQRDGQVFMIMDCNIPTAHGSQVVTDERTPVLVMFSRRSPKNVKGLRCHVGHTTIFTVPFPQPSCCVSSLLSNIQRHGARGIIVNYHLYRLICMPWWREAM